MNDNDKMRAEFEAWAESQDCLTHRGEGGSYWHPDVRKVWRVWQAAYAAGRKAEREAVQKEALQQLVDEAQELDMGY
jgi:hypothetical protein